MTITDLIEILKDRKSQHGNLEVKIDCCTDGLKEIEDIDVPMEDDVLVIWVEG